MTPQERAGLARSILDNPLFADVLDALERSAIDRCINAPHTDHETRAAFAAEARAIRAFRANLEAALRDNQPRKSAPA